MIHAIFWIFILLLAMSFFGISVQAIISSPAGQENFAYLYNLLVQFWNWIAPWFTYWIPPSGN